MTDISGPFDLETGPAYAVDVEYREATGRCGHVRVMELDGWVQECDQCHNPAYDEKEIPAEDDDEAEERERWPQRSYCATHNTYPLSGEPCWQCANPHIEKAYKEGKEESQRVTADLLIAAIPLANEGTLYLLDDLKYRCACCNAEPQYSSASDFEHNADCPVEDLRTAIVKVEIENG